MPFALGSVLAPRCFFVHSTLRGSWLRGQAQEEAAKRRKARQSAKAKARPGGWRWSVAAMEVPSQLVCLVIEFDHGNHSFILEHRHPSNLWLFC